MFDILRLGLILALLRTLHVKVDSYMSSISQDLQTIQTTLEEAGREINEKLDSLDVVSDADKATVADLKAKAQSLADIVPNPTEPEIGSQPEPEPFDDENL